MQNYEPTIGLEVHCQLSTASKIFCPCPVSSQESISNRMSCPICAGHPGTLPQLNKKAVQFAVQAGLALNCKIANQSIFARKNYFYPDLPKGYQISQAEHPLCANGSLTLDTKEGVITIEIERIHLEEDAGKNLHFDTFSLVNLNRAGVGLIEIVSRPQIRSAKQASQYLKALHAILTCLNITDGNMQEGNFRCDANVSVKKKEDPHLGTRVEIKNVNSFKFVEKAIEYEITRQIQVLESGGKITQETRTYDAASHQTLVLRSKEDANDYRYFPEPDLMPLILSSEWIEQIQKNMPELPEQKKMRFVKEYHLSAYDAGVLSSDSDLCAFFEKTIACFHVSEEKQSWIKNSCNLITGELLRLQNETDQPLKSAFVEAQDVALLSSMLTRSEISAGSAKLVLSSIWEKKQTVQSVIQEKGLLQNNDKKAIFELAQKVIEENPTQFAQYKSGKTKLFGFFVGQAMKKSTGPVNASFLNEALEQLLK